MPATTQEVSYLAKITNNFNPFLVGFKPYYFKMLNYINNNRRVIGSISLLSILGITWFFFDKKKNAKDKNVEKGDSKKQNGNNKPTDDQNNDLEKDRNFTYNPLNNKDDNKEKQLNSNKPDDHSKFEDEIIDANDLKIIEEKDYTTSEKDRFLEFIIQYVLLKKLELFDSDEEIEIQEINAVNTQYENKNNSDDIDTEEIINSLFAENEDSHLINEITDFNDLKSINSNKQLTMNNDLKQLSNDHPTLRLLDWINKQEIKELLINKQKHITNVECIKNLYATFAQKVINRTLYSRLQIPTQSNHKKTPPNNLILNTTTTK